MEKFKDFMLLTKLGYFLSLVIPIQIMSLITSIWLPKMYLGLVVGNLVAAIFFALTKRFKSNY